MSSVITQMPLSPAQVNRADTAQWRQIIRQSLNDVRVATPAFLTDDMNADAQTVTVQIAIQERVKTSAGAQWFDVPPIINVPIQLPSCKDWAVTMPLKKGDEGLLIFCDTCFDYWWKYGATGPKAQNLSSGQQASGSQRQLEVRRHHVHDCGFLPGMRSQAKKLANYSSTSMQLRSVDGSIVVDLSLTNGVTITTNKLTVNATDKIQLLSSAEIDITGSAVKIMGKDFLTHSHNGVQSGGSDTGPVV